MDLLHALRDLITRVNNPLANAAPTLAALMGFYCVWAGIRAGTSTARNVGTLLSVTIVSYAATLRTLLEFDVLTVDEFLELSTPNVPLLFSAIAYLFYSRTLATQKMGSDREAVRRFHEEHPPDHGH